MDKEDVMYIYKMEYYWAIKKNKILPFATWMDLESTMLSKINQTEKDNTVWLRSYVESKTNKWTYLQNRNRLTDLENKLNYGYQGGRVGGRDRLEIWDWHVHTAVFKIDNQQGPAV